MIKKKLIVGADHAGFELKLIVCEFLKSQGFLFEDLGTDSTEPCDYPEVAKAVCKKVLALENSLGILICATGAGISIAANKCTGIRAVCCFETYTARLAREHNNANVLCLGSRVLGQGLALEIIEIFANTPFSEEVRHVRRLVQISEMERDGR